MLLCLTGLSMAPKQVLVYPCLLTPNGMSPFPLDYLHLPAKLLHIVLQGRTFEVGRRPSVIPSLLPLAYPRKPVGEGNSLPRYAQFA